MSTRIVWGAGLRWAVSERAWFGLFASLTDGRVLCRHERTFIRTSPEDAAKDIVAFLKEKHITLDGGIVANPQMWPKEQGLPSDIDAFIDAGLVLRRGSGDRLALCATIRRWLAPSGKEKRPALVIHPDCKYLLRTMPMLIGDSSKVDEIAECPQEYPAFGLAQYLASRPQPSTQPAEPPPGPGTWGHALAHVYAGRRAQQGLRGGFRYR